MRQIRGRPTQGLVLLLQQPDLFPRLLQLGSISLRHPEPVPLSNIGQSQPASQTLFGEPEVIRDARDQFSTATGDRDNVTADLPGKRVRHAKHPSSENPNPHCVGVN